MVLGKLFMLKFHEQHYLYHHSSDNCDLGCEAAGHIPLILHKFPEL